MSENPGQVHSVEASPPRVALSLSVLMQPAAIPLAAPPPPPLASGLSYVPLAALPATPAELAVPAPLTVSLRGPPNVSQLMAITTAVLIALHVRLFGAPDGSGAPDGTCGPAFDGCESTEMAGVAGRLRAPSFAAALYKSLGVARHMLTRLVCPL